MRRRTINFPAYAFTSTAEMMWQFIEIHFTSKIFAYISLVYWPTLWRRCMQNTWQTSKEGPALLLNLKVNLVRVRLFPIDQSLQAKLAFTTGGERPPQKSRAKH